MKRERYEKRLFRIFAQAGYAPAQILTVWMEEFLRATESAGQSHGG